MSEAGLIRNSRTPSPTLRELVAILFRHSKFVAFSFALVFVAILLYGLLSPRYEAHLKVLLRRGRSDPVASPRQSTLADFSRPQISEEELNSEVELLRDEELLREVVEKSGLLSAGAPANVKERATRQLARALTVEPLRKSNLIQVCYRSPRPQEAANILAVLSRVYLQKHMALQRPSGELQFFEQQAADYESRLRQSESDLVRFSREHSVAAPALERDIVLQKLGDAEAAYRQLDQERAEAERRTTALRVQLKSFPSRSVTTKRWADNPQLLEKLKSHLLELQLKRTELLTRFEPSYRLVQEVDQQIEETRQSIAAEALTPVRDEITDKDPNYEWARMELEKTEVEADSVGARQATGLAQIANLRGVAQQMQYDSVAQQSLVRNAKAAEDDYLLYRRKREEARIGDALDERRILNVAIVEPPMVPALPVHPLTFWYVIALGLATVSGISSGFAAEYFDPTIRTPDEARRALEIPVLAWLPPVPRPSAGTTLLEMKRRQQVTP
jgi:uncharacterized protein involved in exopolysaccharide biosynthesis